MAIRESGVQFDVIFGPAYKGIPLATALGMAWFQLYGENKAICYNRKEVKDHGEVSCIISHQIAFSYGFCTHNTSEYY
jgi:orotate phosphoribosyltransferase